MCVTHGVMVCVRVESIVCGSDTVVFVVVLWSGCTLNKDRESS